MKKNDLQILRISYLRGPNIWTYRSVLEVWLDLGDLENFPSHILPGFNERLVAWLPALIEHHCGVGERGGFIDRLHTGTWAGHVLEHVVIELLNLAGMQTGFGQTRSTSRHGVYRMVFRARDEHVARSALSAGHRLLMAAINDEPFDVPAAVAQIKADIDDSYLGPSTASIVAGATDRQIPHIRLNEGNLVQLGYGCRQKRIWTAETEITGAIAEGIAGDKDLTKSLLRACGVPVPEGVVVESPGAAWDAAQEIGLPVVVKPIDANHGRGVSLELQTREEIMAAYALAQPHGSKVIVERFIPGNEHRLLVVGGRVVAAARGEVACVLGDGHSTIEQLIDAQINTDPRRGFTEDFPLNLIFADEDETVVLELQQQGLSLTSVPALGRQVLIQRNGNVSIDCTDEVHPEVGRLVSLAARVVGLDVAGIDVVAQDIGKPLAEQGAAVVEVNAGPGLLMHLNPAKGTPRHVGRAIVDHLFAPENSGRIPVIGIAGSQDTHAIARLVAWLLQLGGLHVGLASQDGLFLNSRQVERGPCVRWEDGNRLLMNRTVEAVVIENDAKVILKHGLAYDRCHVGVVTDLAGYDQLSDDDIYSSDQMIKVLRTQVDVVLPEGAAVLNAADERLAAMAPLCDGRVVLYAENPDLPWLIQHCEKGGLAVWVRKGALVLASGSAEVGCLDFGSFYRKYLDFSSNVQATLLAATATAWALGLSPDLIAAGLRAFETSLSLPPLPQSSPVH
ncbi:MAG: cyanophycin synthetase [Burkholderiales bacterium]